LFASGFSLAAQSRLSLPVRRLFNRVVGDRLRVVNVRSGIAKGAQIELVLSREKAYWLGHYEWKTQELLKANVAPGDVVYDVGAHIGFFSICAAKLGARVYAFEPVSANAARIRRQAELNSFPIEVVEAAVWESDAGVMLSEGESSSEWHVSAGGASKSLTLDAFVRTHEPPTLIKIDVEGAEVRVLRGATSLLRSHPPKILCEIHGDKQRRETLVSLAGFDVAEVDKSRIFAVPARTIAV
jgi:FkbM family methyltransferase